MKISVLLILIIFFAACGRIENFTNLTEQKIETEPAENEQPDEPPILEITHEAKGMFDVTGKTLFFNLYENGVIEFEYADEKKKTPGKNLHKAEEINTLMRAKISGDELRKITGLLKTEDFQNVKSEYKNICRSTDTSTDYKINFQNAGSQKTVNLHNYCGSSDVRKPQISNMLDFPKVLSDLLSLVNTTKAKYLPENSSNQSQ